MRRLVVLLYGLLFVSEVVWAELVPLAPRFHTEFGLSKVETGALLSSASVASVLFSMPLGVLADRVGARKLTVAASGLMALATIGQGFAVGFVTLFGARLVYGLAFAAIWTAGLSWLADSVSPERRAAALAAATTVAGTGIMIGPALGGLVADHFGIAAPFVATGGLALALAAALAAAGPGGRAEHEPQATLAFLRAARRQTYLLAAVSIMCLGGTVTSAITLLVPLQLSANGLSAGSIGLAFSAASALSIAVSAAVVRLGSRPVRLRVAGLVMSALGASFSLVLASASTLVVVLFLVLRTPLSSILFTIAYPLGIAGARRAQLGSGAVMGVLNVSWGVATLLGPLVAGAVVQGASARWIYGGLLAVCFSFAGWMLLAARRMREPVQEIPPAPVVTVDPLASRMS